MYILPFAIYACDNNDILLSYLDHHTLCIYVNWHGINGWDSFAIIHMFKASEENGKKCTGIPVWYSLTVKCKYSI